MHYTHDAVFRPFFQGIPRSTEKLLHVKSFLKSLTSTTYLHLLEVVPKSYDQSDLLKFAPDRVTLRLSLFLAEPYH